MLAICYLRKLDLIIAEPLIAEVLRNTNFIKSEARRRQFRLNTVKRLEEEVTLAFFKHKQIEIFDAVEIQSEAGKLIQNKTEDEIFTRIGKFTPPETKTLILKLDDLSRKQLPPGELKFLPNPQDRLKDEIVGRTVFDSVRRVLWRSLCEPNSDIYKAWFNGGMKVVLNKFYIGSIVGGVLAGIGIGIKALVISVVAIVIKFGIEVYCDRYKPNGIMLER